MKALILAAFLAASGPWTLSDCIDYALEHNISIQQSTLNVQQKEVALNTAQNSWLPNVSASASQNFSFGRGLTEDNTYANTNTTSTGLSLGAAMPIFQGFEIKNNILMSKLDLAAATADLEKAKNDIRVAIAGAYVQILYDKELLGVAQGQEAVDSMLVETIETKRNAGKASEAEVAAQRATLANARLSVTQAENNLHLALLDLAQLLELESPEGFDIVSPSVESTGERLLVAPETIYEEALDIKPEINAEKIRMEYAKTSVERAKGGYMPNLSLSGGIGSNYYTSAKLPSASFTSQLSNNFSQYVGLSLNVPVFSRFANRNQVKSAKISLSQQELQLQNVKKSLFKEIQQAYYKAVASWSKLNSSEEAATSARTSYDLMREKYQNGKASVTEYNEAKNRWLEAESNLLQARYEYVYMTCLLDFYRGKDMQF